MPSTERETAEARLTDEDLAALREAVELLEQDTFTETVMNTVGKFIGESLDVAGRFLPKAVRANSSAMLEGCSRKPSTACC